MYKVKDVHDYSLELHASIESNLCPIEDDRDVHDPYLDITSLISTPRTKEKIHLHNLDLSLSPEGFTTELIHLTINDIKPKANTPEDQALDHFTRRNLKRPTMWD